MAFFNGPAYLAATGTAGNVTGASVATNPNGCGHAVQFVVEVAGSTPTVTWKVQGSLDGTNWYDVLYVTDASDTAASAAKVRTTVGADLIFISNPVARQYKYYRVVTTANTNVTYRCEQYETATA